MQDKKELGKNPLIKFYNLQKQYREKNAQIDTKQDVFDISEEDMSD